MRCSLIWTLKTPHLAAQLVALLSCSKKVLGLTPGQVFLNGLYMFSSCMRVNVCAWMFVLCVSVLPCDGLAICPGCTLPLACRPLEIGTSSPATLYGRSGYRKWMDGRCLISA
ncbi:hypothetical protein ILYODFUR_008605 [Ilyodon furcidens]|uniref:Secreted protein n=1 Tax=Ilyodon furcidens TaxID=33524 RepID=A0ABV0SJP0_9TELE